MFLTIHGWVRLMAAWEDAKADSESAQVLAVVGVLRGKMKRGRDGKAGSLNGCPESGSV
jgi:hypothetical protein